MRLLSRNWLVTFFAATYWIDTIYTKPTKVFSTPDLLHQRYDYGVDKHTLTKRSTGHIVTTGVHVGQGPGGSVPQRLEIRELEKDKTMWNLYILGLDMLQWTPQSDRLSWYQIMGIHGRPFLPYDGAVAVPGGEGHGYCSHVSVLLPIWHRPYLVFYEQVLHDFIQQIAAMFPEGELRDNYTGAAQNFRIPYWDWAAPQPPGQSAFPDSIGSPWVDAEGPAGVQRIANPLFSYQFQLLNTTELPNLPFTLYQQTMRYPNATTRDAVSQNHQITTNMDKNSGIFRSRLYNLFTNYHDYSTFSNEAWIPQASIGDFDSLESIHDQVHGFSGGGGHMSYVDYSAFDPLFMLHHAMIDRCFALWQVLNPDSYVEPTQVRTATYTIPAGSTINMNTPLQPFYDSSGDFWDPSTVRATETFGYVYPETANNGTGADRANAVIAINRLYGSSTTGSGSTKLSRKEDFTYGNAARNISYREWIANILVRKHALSGPFLIHIFLGDIEPDPQTWSSSSALVGTHYIFDKMDSSTVQTSCNCAADLVTGTIPLTSAIEARVGRGDLPDLDHEAIEPFLDRHLRFKVSYLNYTIVAASRIPSLKIQVVTAGVKKEVGDRVLPVWDNLEDSIEVYEG